MNRRTDPFELQEHCGNRTPAELEREICEAFPDVELSPQEEQAMYTAWLLELSDEEVKRLQLEADRQEAERLRDLNTASVIALHNLRAEGKLTALIQSR